MPRWLADAARILTATGQAPIVHLDCSDCEEIARVEVQVASGTICGVCGDPIEDEVDVEGGDRER